MSFINIRGLAYTFDISAEYKGHPRIELLPLIIIHQNIFLCLKNILKHRLNTLKFIDNKLFFCGKNGKLFECSGKILANLTILMFS